MNFFFRSGNNKNVVIVLLALAIIIGALVGTWKITALPFPPNGDELAFGYYG